MRCACLPGWSPLIIRFRSNAVLNNNLKFIGASLSKHHIDGRALACLIARVVTPNYLL